MVRIIFIVSLVFLLLPQSVSAAFSITEIMYDLDGTDTNREWVEVCNTGDDAVNFSGWKFNDGSNHGINEPPANGSVGSASLIANECLILAANAETFLSEHSGFSYTVLDTVMNLNNTEGTISILNSSGAAQASTNYTSTLGAAGDGKSLQKNNSGSFIPADPTPGTLGSIPESVSTTQEDANQDDTLSDSGVVSSAASKTDAQMSATLTIPKYVSTGVPHTFDAIVFGYLGEPRTYGYFKYNFGDGTVVAREHPEPVSYTYKYPGEYTITFEYFISPYSQKPEFSIERVVTAVAPGVSIASVLTDGAVILQNKATRDVDLLGFVFKTGLGATTVLPHTIIRSGKTITFPPEISGLSSDVGAQIALLNPSGLVVSEFLGSKTAGEVSNTTKKAVYRKQDPVTIEAVAPKVTVTETNMPFLAQAISSVPPEKKQDKSILFLLAGIGVTLLGAMSFLYLKQKSSAEEITNNSEAEEYLVEEVIDD